MKSKQAERAKKKRRAEKLAAKREHEDKIYKAFKDASEGKPVKPCKKRDVVRAYRQLEIETNVKAIVYAIVAVLYVLHTVYGWGATKILRHARSIYRYINIVGADERSIPQMAEELQIDAGLDAYKLLDNYEPYGGQSKDKQKIAEIYAMSEKISLVLPMILYALYYNEGWKAKRMNRVGSEVRSTLIDMLETDCCETMRKHLETECRLRIDRDGNISYITEVRKSEKT